MKWRRIIGIVILLFIICNCILLVVDKDEKVERTSYIKNWTKTASANMYEQIDKKGVLAAVNQHHIYFDDTMGAFEEFLVDEGAEVHEGDALYTYKVADFDDTKATLEAETDTINEEISAIEQAMSAVSAYQLQNPGTMPNNSSRTEEDNQAENKDSAEMNQIKTASSVTEADYLKEQYLAEKKKELEQKQARLKSVQTQLTDLQASGDTITVDSPYTGNVTELSDSLGNPVMTIASTDVHVEGELTETERMKFEKGMPAEIAISENKKKLKGTIEEINDNPKTVSLHGKSIYPFYVSFTDQGDMKDLLPGYHTKVSITTDESKNATVVPNDALFGHAVWKMTQGGKLVKQPVTTGIEMKGKTEITKGAKLGEWVAGDQQAPFRHGTSFITPLQLDQLKWKQFVKQKDWKEDFIAGLLTR